MKLIRVGVDLAKNVFQLHGVSRDEKVVSIPLLWVYSVEKLNCPTR